MKTEKEILKDLYVTLAELQNGDFEDNPTLETYLRTKLGILYDILGETVPEAFWLQVEKEINKEVPNSEVSL